MRNGEGKDLKGRYSAAGDDRTFSVVFLLVGLGQSVILSTERVRRDIES